MIRDDMRNLGLGDVGDHAEMAPSSTIPVSHSSQAPTDPSTINTKPPSKT